MKSGTISQLIKRNSIVVIEVNHFDEINDLTNSNKLK